MYHSRITRPAGKIDKVQVQEFELTCCMVPPFRFKKVPGVIRLTSDGSDPDLNGCCESSDSDTCIILVSLAQPVRSVQNEEPERWP